MIKIFKEKDEERYDIAFLVALLLLFVQLPIVVLIPLLGPTFFSTLCSYLAGYVAGRYVEKDNGPQVAFLATAFFYVVMGAAVIMITWRFVDPMPGIFRPLDVTAISLIAFLIVLSGIFASIGGHMGSKPRGYYQRDEV